jgi:hypothetical protein
MSTTSNPDATVLAAVDRAERHRAQPGAPVWLIFEHLGIPRRSRRARVQLGQLLEAGALTKSRAHSIELWALTPAGRSRMRRASPVELPESPQHQAWRDARALAGQEISRFRAALRSVMIEASAALDDAATSDVWFEMAEQMSTSARRLGSATFCLYEWDEPNDDVADIDDCNDPADAALVPSEQRRRRARRAGRRNTRLWAEVDS